MIRISDEIVSETEFITVFTSRTKIIHGWSRKSLKRLRIENYYSDANLLLASLCLFGCVKLFKFVIQIYYFRIHILLILYTKCGREFSDCLESSSPFMF